MVDGSRTGIRPQARLEVIPTDHASFLGLTRVTVHHLGSSLLLSGGRDHETCHRLTHRVGWWELTSGATLQTRGARALEPLP